MPDLQSVLIFVQRKEHRAILSPFGDAPDGLECDYIHWQIVNERAELEQLLDARGARDRADASIPRGQNQESRPPGTRPVGPDPPLRDREVIARVSDPDSGRIVLQRMFAEAVWSITKSKTIFGIVIRVISKIQFDDCPGY